MIGKAIFNRSPLPPNQLAPLPLGAIRPEGWLLEQLRACADGLTGHLWEFWPDVNADCAWLGGEGDGWERAPYYLDGLVPLAWELDDERLQKAAMRYIEAIFASQREDGWFGPVSNRDYWPNMIVLKVMMQYFTATSDKRALSFMDKYLKYEYRTVEDEPLCDWAVARAQENMLAAEWLYDLTGQKYLLELMRKLREQCLDWTNHLHSFPHIRAMSRAFTWERLRGGRQNEQSPLKGTDRPYFSTQFHLSHGVNVAMALKAPGVVSMFKSGYKEQNAFRAGWQKLMKHHGVATGIFTCDEHLNGDSPSQGTELCAIVEAMFSMETLIGLGNFDQDLPDMLEKLAFNALPAATTADMRSHQYDEQVNQVRATVEPRNWYNNGDDSNIYGLEPNFGCCTANMHQGWPKFCAHLWYATADDGLAAISYSPCTVRFRAGGQPVRLKVDTLYPFGQTVRISVTPKAPADFPLYLRIPRWAKDALIHLPDGEIMSVLSGETACLRRVWNAGDEVRLELPMEPRVTRWYHRSAAVELGPLLMAFRPREKWEKIADRPFAPDWQVTTDDAWNWALFADEPMKAVFLPENVSAFGMGESAVKVCCKAALAPGWQMEKGSAAPPPTLPEIDRASEATIELVPFGDTGLRIAQFPTASSDPA